METITLSASCSPTIQRCTAVVDMRTKPMGISENISGRFEQLAVTRSNAPALIIPGWRTFTFAHLDAQIRTFGAHLRQWDCSPGDVIAGVMTDRIALALACISLPASATFAPLSPNLSEDAYIGLLRRLRPKVVALACDPTHPARQAAAVLNIAVVELKANADGLSASPISIRSGHEAHLGKPVRQDTRWAYLLSSSGSTGESKLIPVTHENVTLSVAALAEWYRLGPSDVGCHIMPMHLPQGLRIALMLPLLCGSSVLILPENDIRGFFHALEEHGVTWITGGFTHVRHLAERAVEFPQAIARSRLRFIRCGSGTLPPETIRLVEERLRAPMIAAYSAVEACAISIDPLPPKRRRPGGVGLPAHAGVRIVDHAGAPCPVGSVGEIEVRGPMVFEGYFDDPVRTAQAFRDGWYRTGDLGRFDGEGYLFIQGRLKEIINRGGEKILPSEVDAVMEQIPGVLEAAAFAVPHPTLGEELAVAVVRAGDAEPSAGSVKARLYAVLGKRGLPRRVFFVDHLPRTGTGKIKRSELALQLSARHHPLPHTTDASESPLVSALRSMWSTLLSTQHVGLADDFFMLGGDSLAGTRLLSQVKEVFGVVLPLDSLFNDGATVLGMARLVEAARASAAE